MFVQKVLHSGLKMYFND